MNRRTLLLAALSASALSSGCTYTHWKDPISGREFTHIAPAIGNRRIGELDIVKGTMKNYESENAEIARAAAEGAVAAALRQRQQAP